MTSDQLEELVTQTIFFALIWILNEMQCNLLIIRHAQTHGGQYDNTNKERTLKPEGIAEAGPLAKYRNDSDYSIYLIISRYAERARQQHCW